MFESGKRWRAHPTSVFRSLAAELSVQSNSHSKAIVLRVPCSFPVHCNTFLEMNGSRTKNAIGVKPPKAKLWLLPRPMEPIGPMWEIDDGFHIQDVAFSRAGCRPFHFKISQTIKAPKLASPFRAFFERQGGSRSWRHLVSTLFCLNLKKTKKKKTVWLLTTLTDPAAVRQCSNLNFSNPKNSVNLHRHLFTSANQLKFV